MLTTTIGAYPKPATVPIRDWFQKEGGTDTPEPTAGYAETLRQYGARLEPILDRATTLVVREQVELGIDIPTDGEIRRENFIHYHCRHLRGIDFDALTERQMRGDHQKLLPTITGPIEAGPAFLVRDWQVAQSATKRPIKITVPGPLTIGDNVADEYYREDARARGVALADALNVEIRRLAEAGCPVIQIDEPAFARKVERRARVRRRAPGALLPQGAADDRAGGAHLLRLSRHARCRGLPQGAECSLFRARRRARRDQRSMRSRSRTRTCQTISRCSSALPARR